MNEELFSMILSVIVMAAILAMTGFIIPVLKQRIGQERLAKIEDYISMAVRYAEQVYGPAEWENKKQFVMDYTMGKINELGVNLGLTTKDVNILIEAIVHELKHEG